MTIENSKPLEVGIVGGGMMGLATAFHLAENGVHVTVLEKDKEIGGLSRSEEIMPGVRWDRFYHVILSTDDKLLEFIDEIGLSADVHFRETKTGFYTDGRLHSMSNLGEFLRFKPLSLLNKLRLGLGILYSSRIRNWKRLERMYAEIWLIRVFGRKNYEKIWEPLLRSKLGSASNQASGSFIWACINRYYGTRSTSAKKELMGCVRGGYHSILNRIQEILLEKGTKVLLDHAVEDLEPLSSKRIRLHCQNGKTFDFDRVVATVPNPHIIALWPEMPEQYKTLLQKIRYLNLICATLLLRKPLTPFYVTNLTDDGFPFTGVIDTTNVIPLDVLGRKALIYLPRYSVPVDPFFEKPNEEVLDIFLQALRRIFPDLRDRDIIAAAVNRERYVQPIQEINYSRNVPYMKTPLANMYIANTTMILNSTLNNNQVIQVARKMANHLLR
jgi:protoporphyrinogen oxidase